MAAVVVVANILAGSTVSVVIVAVMVVGCGCFRRFMAFTKTDSNAPFACPSCHVCMATCHARTHQNCALERSPAGFARRVDQCQWYHSNACARGAFSGRWAISHFPLCINTRLRRAT